MIVVWHWWKTTKFFFRIRKKKKLLSCVDVVEDYFDSHQGGGLVALIRRGPLKVGGSFPLHSRLLLVPGQHHC